MTMASRCGWWVLAAVLVLADGRAALGLRARSGGGGTGRGWAGTNVNHGAVGYLGIDVRDIGDGEVATLKLKDSRGAEIVRVDHDGPAGKCGLREHDVVLVLNGQAIEGEEQIRRMLRDLPPGRPVTLIISRDGQTMSLNTQMADRDLIERQAWEQHITVPDPGLAGPSAPADDPAENFVGSTGAPVRGSRGFLGSMLLMSPSYTGAMLEMLGPQLAEFFGVPDGVGLLVRSVATNSPAALAGMHAGDVAIRANAQRLTTMGEWSKTIRESKGRPVTVVVLRDKKEVTLTLTPDGKKRSSLERQKIVAQWACLTEL
jgi:serine protease Do